MNDSQSLRRGTEERRQQLLDAARVCFAREGYAGASVSAIVREAGVAQGTFYVYFESKQAVLTELRRETFRDYAVALNKAAELPLPADARLVATIRSILDAVQRNLVMERVFRQAESAGDSERSALEGRARLAKTAARFLAEGAAAGELTIDDPGVVAELVVTLFDQVLYEALEYERPAPVGRTAELTTRFVLRGLGVAETRIEHLMAEERRA